MVAGYQNGRNRGGARTEKCAYVRHNNNCEGGTARLGESLVFPKTKLLNSIVDESVELILPFYVVTL